jgi:hypothetical protein
MIPVGLKPEKGCAGDAQQNLKTTDPTSRQRGRPTSTNLQLSKTNSENYRPDFSSERPPHINKPTTV